MTQELSSGKIEGFIECLRGSDWIAHQGIVGMTVHGSLVRGDYVNCVVDIDIFMIVNKQRTSEQAGILAGEANNCE